MINHAQGSIIVHSLGTQKAQTFVIAYACLKCKWSTITTSFGGEWLSIYTVLQKYAHIVLKQNLLRSITLDIITRSLDNAAFVCIHVVGRFSKDFLEVRGSRSRGFQLQVE